MSKIPFVTKKTKRFLKIKTILYLLSKKNTRVLFLSILKRVSLWKGLFKSAVKKYPYKQEGDSFFFGCSSSEDFKRKLRGKGGCLVLGISYCQKPLKCPLGRFNDKCQKEENNPICNTCWVGLLKKQAEKNNKKVIIIPTFHDIAEFLIKKSLKEKEVFFLITACELSLKMFADSVQVFNLVGVGFRLRGRFCNTFKAFKLAEEGIKPGQTLLDDTTLKNILDFLKIE